LNDRGVVRYDENTKKVEKVVDGFDKHIECLFKDENGLYVGGAFKQVGDLELNDCGIVYLGYV
ncbi:MAG: hypothetical protein QXD48_03230, partial [Candidatus Aenigmatarchaeota archaeon]